MEADWWARGLALAGVAMAGLGLAWRLFEWVTVRQRAVKVIAFVEQFRPARCQSEIVPLEKIGWSGVRIHLVNEGRPISIDSAGLLGRKNDTQYVIHGPENLPAQLQTHSTLDIHGNPGEEWKAAVRTGSAFIPYAQDSEGHIYKGRHRKVFDEQARALVAQFDEWELEAPVTPDDEAK